MPYDSRKYYKKHYSSTACGRGTFIYSTRSFLAWHIVRATDLLWNSCQEN